MATAEELAMSRTSNWRFNFDSPTNFNLDDIDEPEVNSDGLPTPTSFSKSPRPSEDDGEHDEGSQSVPTTEEALVSLFGGGAHDQDDKGEQGTIEPQTAQEDADSGQGFRNHISSLRLDEETNNTGRLGHSGDFGVGPVLSDIGSVCDSPTPSEDEEFVIPPDTQAPYQLRQNIERNRVFTYHDADESGNYNPETEARERALEIKKSKAAKKAKIKTKVKQRFAKDRTESNEEQPPQVTDQQPGEGCVSCLDAGIDCSMISDGRYPCSQCSWGIDECQPIAEDVLGNRCKRRKAPKTPTKKKPKKPEKPSMTPGSRRVTTVSKVDQPLTLKAPKPRKTQPVYLTAKDFEDMNDVNDHISSREATPDIIMEDQAGNRGFVTQIQTSFAHPIMFNEIIDDTAIKEGCHFCEMNTFSLLGYLEKTVHVVQWETGLGYTEIGGGHCEENGPTTMCRECALSRASTVACIDHELQQIYTGGEVAFENAITSLLQAQGNPTEIRHELQYWCSMCFSLAVFACCKPSASQDMGCGLRLCEPCEIDMREKYGGCSSTMAEVCDREPKFRKTDREMNPGQRVRADVGFLSNDGLLVKFLKNELAQQEAMG